nr:MAG TPA: hypothetical protein [Crassvirales sp.]
MVRIIKINIFYTGFFSRISYYPSIRLIRIRLYSIYKNKTFIL